MKKKASETAPGRRGFLLGMMAGVGAATVAAAGLRKAQAKQAPEPKGPKGPVLYRRTAETERYYKTLYN